MRMPGKLRKRIANVCRDQPADRHLRNELIEALALVEALDAVGE
jgi:hypothetical protein